MSPAVHSASVRRRAAVALSQYVQQSYAVDLLDSGDGRRIGYLLKDRVVDVEDFIAALRQVVDGGTVVDPQVVLSCCAARAIPWRSCPRVNVRSSRCRNSQRFIRSG
jgi:DNA-binding NarL/FixJ family response regulator